jgi:hypothetical protein
MTDPLAGLGTAVRGYPRPAARPGQLAAHLSVSQIESYQQCGMKYRLQRLDGEQETPAWWNVGGTAFHATIEWWEREALAGTLCGSGDAQVYFSSAFGAEIAPLETSSGVPRTAWRAASKGTEGEKWWREKGALMVNSYVLAHSDPAQAADLGFVWDSSHPDDAITPALELPFAIDVAGIELIGYIDQVRQNQDGWLVRDLKSGSRVPSSTFQLGVYAHALRIQYSVTGPIWGEYWMARKGEATARVDLFELWPWGAIVYQAHQTERGRRAGLFPAVPSSFCGSCGVREACPTMTGNWPVTIIPSPFGRTL